MELAPHQSWRYWFSVFVSMGIPILFLIYTIFRQFTYYGPGRDKRRRPSLLLDEARRVSRASYDWLTSDRSANYPTIVTHKPSNSASSPDEKEEEHNEDMVRNCTPSKPASSPDEEEEEDAGDLVRSIKKRNFTIISTWENHAVEHTGSAAPTPENTSDGAAEFAKEEAKRIVQNAIKRHQIISEVKELKREITQL